MNLTQWLLVATPVLVAYVLFVFFAESDGKRNIPAHAAGGLLVIPLILAMTPFILLSAGVDLLRKRKWGEAVVSFLFVLLIAGYGALVFHLRDRPPPSPDDLQVESPYIRR